VPGVLGIHLEGPYLAPARKGTHDAGKFRVPDADEIAMAASLDNGITLVTLAPERVPAETVRALAQRGVRLCAGHTAASYEQARAGIDAGITGFTHLYNAMTPLQGREPGVVGAALDADDCWVGVIVDGVHVHPASLRVALKAKPRGKVLLVTDAMPMVGGDAPGFDLYGETITAIDGVVRNAAGALAGSALDMASAVRNTVRLLDLSLDEACRMAAQYPAEFLGLGGELGRIAPGYRADLVLLDGQLRVQGAWIGGR
jgi:N-acetylglucosamine-6-phosphate deacetylase